MMQPNILLQVTWKTKESWDVEVNNEIKIPIFKIGKTIEIVKKYKNSQMVRCDEGIQFNDVDATYAACIFLRSDSSMGSVTVTLLQARSRITLMKTITIPRRELMAATIGAGLFSSVKQALKLPNIKAYFGPILPQFLRG
ncbi:uncharacterized protein CEXT_440831 [Caerostris extrusa]|uniref:Uncharacterized protein n=1 Tax=Caerostris extrusa TaxID=172846 RepID=A0AAV4QY69_CAEEX|nr:uncharacterized protein CEXT_440831 [Caerostris extrusa]